MSGYETREIGLGDLPPEAAQGLVFSRPNWLSLQGEKLELRGIYGEGGTLDAYYACLRRSLGAVVPFRTAPRFTPYAPSWIREGGTNKSNAAGKRKRILAAIANDLALRRGVVALAFPPSIIDMQPFAWRGFKVIPRYTYRIDLRRGEEAVRADMSPKRRNDLSKALREGVAVETCSDSEALLALVQRTFDRKGRDFERALAKRIMDSLLEGGDAFAKIARLEGRTVAAAFCAFDGDTAFYLFGGHESATPLHGAGALVLWECIREAASRKLATFDFEGSMIPEVEAFFREFGGDLVPYYVVNRASFALETALKLLRRSQF